MSWNVDLPDTMYFGPKDGVVHYACPFTGQYLDNTIREVIATEHVSIDTETTGLVSWKDIPLYWSLAWGRNKRATLHASLLPYFTEAFNDRKKQWIFANAKYDAHILANVGVNIAGRMNDVQVQHSLLYEDKPHRLKFIAQHILGWTWADFTDTFGKIGKTQSAEELIRKAEAQDFNLLVEYAANDAWGTLWSYWELRKQLESQFTYSLFSNMAPYINTLWDLFDKVEVPFTKVLWKMERRGILVDVPHLEKSRPEAEEEIKKIEKDIVKHAGRMLNANSPKQMQEYFIKELGLKPLKWTKGGKSGVRQPSIDGGFLEHYQYEVPVAGFMLKHREYSKLLGTYIIGLRDICDPDGRVHTSFNQDVARTGRLSSSDPNVQNIPRPENDKWGLRDAFITLPDWNIIAADYGQLEMRLLAAASMEEPMIDIFRRGWDIHMGNASMMFDIPYEHIEFAKDTIDKGLKKEKFSESEVLQIFEQKLPEAVQHIQAKYGYSNDGALAYVRACIVARSDAKNIGFGLNYGMGAGKLSRQINATLQEAQEKIHIYKGKYPAVDKFFKEAVEEGKKYGYSFTVLGRRRNIPMITSHRKDEQALGERLAVNCVDLETEALTKRGWVRGDVLTAADELLAYDMKSGTLQWEKPSEIKLYPEYEGPIVSFESKTFSAKTTPEHRWAVYNKSTGRMEEKLSNNISRYGDHRIVRTGEFIGAGNAESNDRLKLIGWFLTDGFICKKQSETYSQRVGLCQSLRAKPNNVKEIDDIIERLGIKASRTVNKSDCVYWYFIGSEADMLVNHFPDRELTAAFVASLCKDEALLVLRTMLKGDGSYYEPQNLTTFCCGRAATVDAFQAMAAIAGYATTVKYRDMSMYTPTSKKLGNVPKMRGCYYVTLLNRGKVQIQREHVQETVEACPVWCPVVPSTFFVARRNGKVYITGNTQIQGSAADVTKMAQLNIDSMGFDRDYSCFMLLQVHDELVFECPQEAVPTVRPMIEDLMGHPFPIELACPLEAEAGFGRSWGQAK